MSQRESEYERKDLDAYFTPHWVTELLCEVEPFRDTIWEPACGAGHMVDALFGATESVITASDIYDHGKGYSVKDFLQPWCNTLHTNADIVTNPPFNLAQKFIEHALDMTGYHDGKVAMLLPFNFDAAKGRRHIFNDHPAFKAKHTLTSRIRWANLEQKKNGPSTNHAWFVWDWTNSSPPIASYLFKEAT